MGPILEHLVAFALLYVFIVLALAAVVYIADRITWRGIAGVLRTVFLLGAIGWALESIVDIFTGNDPRA